MVGSVLFVDCAAGRATLARVSRIDEQHRNTGSLGLVGDKCLKLSEGPVAKSRAVGTTGLDPSADVLEIFKPNAAPGALRFHDDCLRNAVIGVGLKSPLFAGKLAKTALRCFASAALKPFASIGQALPRGFDARAAVHVTVAVRGEVYDAKIDAENLSRQDRIGLVNVTHARKVKRPAHKHQIDFALAKSEKVSLTPAHHRLDFQPPRQRPDTHHIARLKADDTVVIGLSGVLAKAALRLLVQLVCIGRLGNAAHCDLCSKSEALANVRVAKLVQIEGAQNASLKALRRQVIASRVAALQRLFQRLKLLRRRLQFNVGNELHNCIYRKIQEEVKASQRPFLCYLKEAVSRPQDL